MFVVSYILVGKPDGGKNLFKRVNLIEFCKEKMKILNLIRMAFIYPAILYAGMEKVLPDRKKPFITSEVRGQLGNQLYQAAAGIVLAYENNACYIHPHDSPVSRKYPEIFAKFQCTYKISKKYKFPEKFYNYRLDPTYNYIPIVYKDDMTLVGSYLSYKYFDSYRELIMECFGPTKKIVEELKARYAEVFKEDIVVGLHVRTFEKVVKNHNGNKKKVYKILPGPNMGYIKKAMELFPKDCLFVVCSDRINWVKKAFKGLNKRFYFVEDSEINDFYMLSLCHHNIIAHSSFSWWAAYLNQNPEKIVVVPNPFFPRPNVKFEDVYPKDWIVIDRVEDGLWPVFNEDYCWEKSY
ncbi:alpha-1,2-fucosyltransferase [bacterium]|nr:alpha-1,2-fucosyltransferase [bacterium]